MDAFLQHRTWRRAWRLSLAQLVCPGRHTLTNVLCTCGREFQDWSADYRLFSVDSWDPARLFRPVLRGVLEMSSEPSVFVTALDDTHLRKTGKKTPGVAYRRDPLSPPFHCNLIRGQRFLQMSAILSPAALPGPGRALPIRYLHVPPVPKPSRTAPEEDWKAYRARCRKENLSWHAVGVLGDVRRELDQQHDARDRVLVTAVDGSYTNQTVLKNLPERTTVIGRVRKDAKLFYPPAKRDPSIRGPKPKYGRPAPTPEALRQDSSVPWKEIRAHGAGKVHTFRVKTIAPVLWKKAGQERPLRLVVIAPVGYRVRKGSKLLYRKPAYLICTDPDLPVSTLVQYYLWRWDIEVNHRDEKQLIGVGEAQVRAPHSVDRQPPFAVASYSMLLLAAARAFGVEAIHTSLPLPKWRSDRNKVRISTQELIQHLRHEVWGDALEHLVGNYDHVAPPTEGDTKSAQFALPLASAVLYGATG
jgi:hypothetical protein